MTYKLSELKGKIRVGDEIKQHSYVKWKKVIYLDGYSFETDDCLVYHYYPTSDLKFDLKPCHITWDNINAGDFVEYSGGKRMVLSVHDLVIILSEHGNYNKAGIFPYTAQELKELGYTIVQPPQVKPIREVTMKEVHEKFGEEVKIKEEP